MIKVVKMKISELPSIIQDHIKKRNPDVELNKMLQGAFVWSGTKEHGEGHEFWSRIDSGDFTQFFKKYEETIPSDFVKNSKYPKELVGNKYIVVKLVSSLVVNIGDVLELEKNDGTSMPLFKILGTGQTSYVFWSQLIRYNSLTSNDDVGSGFTQIPTKVKEGDKFKIVSYTRIDNSSAKDYFDGIGLSIGDIVVLERNDNSPAPNFVVPGGIRRFINWGCLAPIENSGISDLSKTKRSSKQVNNLNIEDDVKNDHQSCSAGISTQLLCPVSIAISIGTFGGGSSICCAAEEVRMGS